MFDPLDLDRNPKSDGVDQSSLPEWRTKAPKDTELDLVKQGIIPQRVEEEFRLTDSADPINQRFRAAIRQLFAPYVPEQELSRLDTVVLRIGDIEGCFGFAITDAPKPIVGLDRAALDPQFKKSPKSLDGLIGILVHEFAHVFFAEQYKIEVNGKAEEAAADIIAVQKLHEWGLDPRAYLEFMQGLHDPKLPERGSYRHLRELFDVHPLSATRLSYVAAEITRLEQSKGELKVLPKPLPDPNPFVPLLEQLKHCTAFLKSSAVAQFTSITEFLDTVEGWNKARTKELQRGFTTLEPVRLTPDVRIDTVVDQCADALLRRIERVGGRFDESLYSNEWVAQERRGEAHRELDALVTLYEQISTKPPITSAPPLRGRLSPIAVVARKAIEAGAATDRADALEQLVPLIKGEALFTTSEVASSLKTVPWPTFQIPKEAGAEVPWNSVLKEALARAEHGSEDALLGLLYLGVKDLRIFQALSPAGVLRYLERAARIPSEHDHYGESNWGITHGGSFTATYQGKRRDGTPFERSEWVYESNLKISPDGIVEAIPTDVKSHFQFAKENHGRIAQALYRPGLFAELDRTTDLFEKTHAHIEFLIGDLNSEFGEKGELFDLPDIIDRPNRFLARNRGILSDPQNQARICDYVSQRAGDAKSDAERQRIRSAFDRLIPSALGLRLSQSMHDLGDLTGKVVSDVVSLSPFTTYPYLEQQGLFSYAEKLRRFSAEMDYLPRKSERVLYRPIFEALFRDISIPADSWGDLAGKIGKVKEILEREFLTPDLDQDEREYRSREYVKKALDGFVELMMDVDLGNPPTLQEIAAVLQHTRSFALSNKDPLPSIRDAAAITLDAPLQFSSDPAAAVREWSLLHDGYVLISAEQTHPELERVLELPAWTDLSSSERRKLYAELLSSRHVSSHAIKKRLVTAWCAAAQEELGRDDGSQQFSERCTPYLDAIKEFSGRSCQIDTYIELARVLRMQRECALLCRERVQNLEALFQTSSAFESLCVDIALDDLRRNPEHRADIRNFLVEPLTQQSVDALFTKHEDSLFRIGIAGLEVTSEHHQRLHREERTAAIANLHRNFWSAPLEARALMARELLLPSGQESEEAFRQAYEDLFARICPEDSPDHKDARRFLTAYADRLPEYARPYFLGALLVAAHPEDGKVRSLGQAVALVAAVMGPIENKVVQGAHSHHGTPEHIRVDISRSKTMVAAPTQWELHEMIETELPPAIREQITNVGEIVGAASFFISVRVSLVDGREVVLQLLRPHAEERAELGLKRLRETAEQLIREDGRFTVLQELCDEAERSFRSEVNLGQAIAKSEAAGRMYDGSSEIIDGIEVPIHTCTVIALPNYGAAVGDRWRMLTLVEGDLFLDLVEEGGAENTKLLRRLSRAIALHELGLAISGQSMDDDWHGGNLFVTKTGLVRIDHGSICLEKPSDEDLMVLGQIMKASLANLSDIVEPAGAFLAELRRRRALGETLPGVVRRFQKSLLTFQEYERFFAEGDREWLLTELFGRAHPKVIEGFNL